MCISIPLTFGFAVATLFLILIFYGNRDVMLSNYFANDCQGLDHHACNSNQICIWEQNKCNNDPLNFSFSAKVIGQTAPEAITSVELNSTILHDSTFWLIILGFPMLLGLILPLLNFGLRKLSLWLNDIENHRTEAEYRTHFIIKVFAFRFVCYFVALYYYSFVGVGSSDSQATEQGILRVASTLFAYLTFAHWWNMFLNVCFPLLLYRWRVYRERLNLRNELRDLEMRELDLAPSNEHDMTADERLDFRKKLLNKRLLLEHAQVNIWEEMMLPEHDSFTEYLFSATQFAYVACFSVVLPITPLIVLINYLLNMRLDAFKICRGRRRPLSQKTGGIGVWNHVLHIVTVIGVLTNCSLMALTSNQFSDLRQMTNGLLIVFVLAIGWEHLMLLLKYIMQLTVSTMPASVQNEIKRKKYDQERKRYMTLRAKKERRSGSVGVASITHIENDENNSGETATAGMTLNASPCPPIRESSAESNSHSSLEYSSAEEKSSKNVEVINEKSANARRVVNVRATTLHSPQQAQHSNLKGSTQKLYTSKDPTRENRHPNNNFEDAISKLPVQRSATSRSALQSTRNTPSGYGLTALKGLYRSKHTTDGERNNSRHQSRHEEEELKEEEEEVMSPTSSLSTVPRMPTPRELNLSSENDGNGDDDEESLYTIEDDDFQTPGGSGSGGGGGGGVPFYQGASAPPLSVSSSSKNHSYGHTPRRSTVSSGIAYFSTLEQDEEDEEDENDDNDDLPKSKWGVHHFATFARSERSLSLSERKKSR